MVNCARNFLKFDFERKMDTDDEEEEIAAAALIIGSIYFKNKINRESTNIKKKKRTARSVWVREWLERRPTDGAYAKLLQELRLGDKGEKLLYHRFLRMSYASFEYLLNLVSPLIQKNDTLFRDAISAGERLALTLHYLATGHSFRSLQYLFRIPQCTISMIVPEVLGAIWTVLKDEYMKVRIIIDIILLFKYPIINYFLYVILFRHLLRKKNGWKLLKPFNNGIYRIVLELSMESMSSSQLLPIQEAYTTTINIPTALF